MMLMKLTKDPKLQKAHVIAKNKNHSTIKRMKMTWLSLPCMIKFKILKKYLRNSILNILSPKNTDLITNDF